jgi:tetratricopeptide (TPR) repeat protein
MLFSFDAIESLPLFSKLPFNSKEKRVLGITFLISSSLLLFFMTAWVAFKVTSQSVVSEDMKEDTVVTVAYYFDTLEQTALLNQVDRFIYQEKYFEAGELLEKLSYIESPSKKQSYVTAKLLVRQERYLKARKIITPLLQQSPTHLQIAKLYLETFTAEELINAKLEDLTPRFVNSPQILTLVGKKILHLEPEEALLILKKSHLINKDNGDTNYYLALAYEKRGDSTNLVKAETYIEHATILNPDSSQYHAKFGFIQHALYELQEEPDSVLYRSAELAYKKALDLQPMNQTTLYNLAELYSTHKVDHEKSEVCFNKIIDSNPSFWQASFKLGLLYLKHKKYAGALKTFKNALEQSPDNMRVLHQIAVTFEKLGNIDSAQDTYNHILTINPKDDIALYKTQFFN